MKHLIDEKIDLNAMSDKKRDILKQSLIKRLKEKNLGIVKELDKKPCSEKDSEGKISIFKKLASNRMLKNGYNGSAQLQNVTERYKVDNSKSGSDKTTSNHRNI